MPNRLYTHTHTYIYIYIYKEDWALNNLQWLIYHKIKRNKIIYIQYICIKRNSH